MTSPLPRADRVAVVGGGGIGGYLAASLHDAGADPLLCVRTPIDELVVTAHGRTRTVPLRIASDPARVGPVDVVVLAVKGQDTAGAAAWLDALAGPGTVVVVAQNGVDHRERVGPLVPASRVLPILIHFTVEPLGRGRLRHAVGNRLVVPEGDDGDRLATLLDGSGLEIERTDDVVTAAWRKFLGNVVANPLTALTLRRSEVLRDKQLAELRRALLAEAIAVGRGDGARFADDELARTLRALDAIPAENGTSMLFDRLAGRPLEHALITGVVVARGRRHGIPTPANEVLLALLGALDRGLRAADPSAD